MTVLPKIIHTDDFEAWVEDPFDGALISTILQQHNIEYTLRMYEVDKLEPAIEDGRRYRKWDLKDISVIYGLTIPETALAGFTSFDIKACIILHNITIEDLVLLVQRSIRMKAFL